MQTLQKHHISSSGIVATCDNAMKHFLVFLDGTTGKEDPWGPWRDATHDIIGDGFEFLNRASVEDVSKEAAWQRRLVNKYLLILARTAKTCYYSSITCYCQCHACQRWRSCDVVTRLRLNFRFPNFSIGGTEGSYKVQQLLHTHTYIKEEV